MLTDLEFVEACKRYAKKKGKFEFADDFGQEAYLMRLKWPHSSMRQYWFNFWRDIYGADGYAKNRVVKAIHGRKSQVGNADYLENFIRDKPVEEKIRLPYLTPIEQALRLLLEEDFKKSDLMKIMNRSENEILHLLDSLREKVIHHEPEWAENLTRQNYVRDKQAKEYVTRRRLQRDRCPLRLLEFEKLLGNISLFFSKALGE